MQRNNFSLPSYNFFDLLNFPIDKVVSGEYKILHSDITTNSWSTFYSNALAGYQVPADTQFRIMAIHIFAVGASALGAKMAYGDNSVVNSASAPTNAVILGNGSGNNLVASANTLNKGRVYILDFLVPAAKYPALNASSTGASAFLIGKEEAV